MIGYRDRSWCSRYNAGTCVNHNCNLAFTEQDKLYAIAWWGNEEFPIWWVDAYSGGCGFVPKSTKGTDNVA